MHPINFPEKTNTDMVLIDKNSLKWQLKIRKKTHKIISLYLSNINMTK